MNARELLQLFLDYQSLSERDFDRKYPNPPKPYASWYQHLITEAPKLLAENVVLNLPLLEARALSSCASITADDESSRVEMPPLTAELIGPAIEKLDAAIKATHLPGPLPSKAVVALQIIRDWKANENSNALYGIRQFAANILSDLEKEAASAAA